MVRVKTGSQVWTAQPVAAALAFASQLVHLWILPGEFAARPLVGVPVFLAAVCEGLLAASFLLGSGRWAVRLGILLNTTIVFVWVVTRFWGSRRPSGSHGSRWSHSASRRRSQRSR